MLCVYIVNVVFFCIGVMGGSSGLCVCVCVCVCVNADNTMFTTF